MNYAVWKKRKQYLTMTCGIFNILAIKKKQLCMCFSLVVTSSERHEADISVIYLNVEHLVSIFFLPKYTEGSLIGSINLSLGNWALKYADNLSSCISVLFVLNLLYYYYVCKLYYIIALCIDLRILLYMLRLLYHYYIFPTIFLVYISTGPVIITMCIEPPILPLCIDLTILLLQYIALPIRLF